MLTILAESALRSLILGSVVWIGLNLLRLRNPHVHMTSWVMVLLASLSMPLLMHWTVVGITTDALPAPAAENLWPENLWPAGSAEPLRSSLPSEQAMPSRFAARVTPSSIGWASRRRSMHRLPDCCC
ncbi:MAG: hypothetical protein ACXU9D_06740 [Xanthobacteraceae bacterium]